MRPQKYVMQYNIVDFHVYFFGDNAGWGANSPGRVNVEVDLLVDGVFGVRRRIPVVHRVRHAKL